MTLGANAHDKKVSERQAKQAVQPYALPQLIFLNKGLLCMFQITSSFSPFKIKHEWLHIATNNFRILSHVTPNSLISGSSQTTMSQNSRNSHKRTSLTGFKPKNYAVCTTLWRFMVKCLVWRTKALKSNSNPCRRSPQSQWELLKFPLFHD